MTQPAGTPGDEVPEADWAEQAVEAGPVADGHPPAGAGVVVTGSREANEADIVEQELPVDLDDEER